MEASVAVEAWEFVVGGWELPNDLIFSVKNSISERRSSGTWRNKERK